MTSAFMAGARARFRAGILVVFVGGGLVTVSLPVRAAGNDESLAAGLEQFDQGRRAYEAGQLEQALLAFQGSYELFASPNTRYYIGRCAPAATPHATTFAPVSP